METREALKWQEQAACAGMPLDLFFTTRHSADMRLAKRTCDGCPVKAQCLEQNMGERFGIFGGLTPHERAMLGGANNPLPEDFPVNERGMTVDEGLPDPDKHVAIWDSYVSTELETKTAHAKRKRQAKREQNEKLREGRVARAVELYQSGLGLKATGSILGVSKSTVRVYLGEQGVEIRPEGLRSGAEATQRMMEARGWTGTKMKENETARQARKREREEKKQARTAQVMDLYTKSFKVTYEDVARETGLSPSTVKRVVSATGYDRLEAKRVEAVRLYTEEKISSKVIGERLGMYPRTVRDEVQRAGHPLRDRPVLNGKSFDPELLSMVEKRMNDMSGRQIAKELGLGNSRVSRMIKHLKESK